MGAAGTDTAIETADLALMKDDLAKIAETVVLGRRTVRVIQANIIFALIVKAMFLVLAVLGYTSLWLAIAADTGRDAGRNCQRLASFTRSGGDYNSLITRCSFSRT